MNLSYYNGRLMNMVLKGAWTGLKIPKINKMHTKIHTIVYTH